MLIAARNDRRLTEHWSIYSWAGNDAKRVLKTFSAFGGVPSEPACSPVGILQLWVGAFGERVCWWDVGLLVISAFAGGKSFCW